ncbi:MAG: carboxymuconolactone decarboxylase family protein [Candidatus Manganitrophus sp. SA1]|nr:carboxymuconolactone decarboxylase family protein [Candidatus Manganitrophus morganii]
MSQTREEKDAISDDLFAEMRRLSPKVTGGILRAREASYEDGKVAGKYKVLTALAVSIAIRCEPCIRAYVRMAVDRNVAREELIEFLNVAMTMQGCPGEEWAIKAYAIYKELTSAGTSEHTDGCCPVR